MAYYGRDFVEFENVYTKKSLLMDILLGFKDDIDMSDQEKLGQLGTLLTLCDSNLSETDLRDYISMCGVAIDCEFLKKFVAVWVGSKLITLSPLWQDSLLDVMNPAYDWGQNDPESQIFVKRIKEEAKAIAVAFDLQ